MCGVAGFFGDFPNTLLDRMSAAIAHRGPDDSGRLYLPEHHLGLAHRRLSIIDLSPLGHQPMTDETGSCVIAYNGEIYNYRELRNELERAGFRFRSHSDTEVILNLYLRDGADAFPKLNGIFAFALYDKRSETLLLARDGMGVKPLYYAVVPDGVLFASELKALLPCAALPRDLDLEAIQDTISFLWCPAPRTVLRSVRKLRPGELLTLREGAVVSSTRFYRPPAARADASLTAAESIPAVRDTLARAVERQMVSDVPVGAFLSGGLDSSAVCAFARRAAGRSLPCFTIALDTAGEGWDGFSDDLPFARRAAAALDLDLHTITAGPDMIDELDRMIHHLDEPHADPAPLHVLFISRLAREHGIKVLLSGAGGDDLFTGYRRHYALLQERWWGWLPSPVRSALRSLTGRLPARTALGRRLERAFRHADQNGDERIAGYFQWLDPTRQRSLYAEPVRHALSERPFAAPLRETLSSLPAGMEPLDRMLYLEQMHFLADHNLAYTDKMAMAVGVEVRVPFLDPDLVALAASLPARWKQRGRCGKWILKRAMEGILPRDIIYRPKTGFGAPLRAWLRGPLRPLTEDLLGAKAIFARGLFDPVAVGKLLDDDRNGRIDAAYPLFALLCIELWCRRFLDTAVPDPL